MKDRPLLFICLSIVAAVILAVMAGGGRMIRELRASPLELYVEEGQRIRGTGEVCRTEQKARIQAVYLKNVSIRCADASFFENYLLIYTEPQTQLKIGNTVEVLGEVSFFQHAGNPGNFDQKRYYQIRDIHGLVWASSVTVTDPDVHRISQRLSEFRQGWRRILLEELEEEKGSALAAIMLGEKSGMDPELKALYQAGGIGHILAISGLHLSLIGLGTYGILRRLTGSYLLGGAAGILFLCTYVVMIGITVSVARALIMFLFRVGADMTGRKYDGATALGAAAAVILICRPLYLYDGGFWMSFGAVLAMTMILPLFRGLPVQGFWASLSVNLLLLPVILRCFFEIPIYAVFLNLYVIPLLSVLLLLGMAGSAVCLVFPMPGALILRMAGVILSVYETGCTWTLWIPGARWITGMPEWYGVLGYYLFLGIVLILEFRRRKKKEEKRNHRRRFLYGLIWMTGLWLMCCRSGERGSVEIAVLDVGQGDCIFIQGPEGKHYLVDGGSSDVDQVGRYRIEPFLKSQGAGRIDYVLVSHGDEDHINGIRELIERRDVGIQIEKLVLPVRQVWDDRLLELEGEAQRAGIAVYEMSPGDVLAEEELRIVCLAPDGNEGLEPGNETSMVLAVRYGVFDMLLTGDVEGEGEECLTEVLRRNGAAGSWDVLKAAHHGSDSSSSQAFIDVVRPEYTLISAGTDNPYGHPAPAVLERLRASGSRILTTQDLGAILIQVRDGRMFLRRMKGDG